MESEVKPLKMREIILINHEIPFEYQKCYYRRFSDMNWKDQILFLFINALNSGGRGQTENKYRTIVSFETKINQMEVQTYEELLRVFEARDYEDLFNRLIRFNQVGKKKAALFLRDIFYITRLIQTPDEILTQYQIPVDKVITRMINSINNQNLRENSPSTIEFLNNFARQIFPENPILLDDLWFWGHFYPCLSEQTNNPCHFNRARLYVDVGITKTTRDRILNFIENNQDICPFHNICQRHQQQ